MDKRVFITAAEVSGDRNAASLVTALLKLDPTISAEGHGGPAMAEAGVKIHHETVGGAAMGWRGRVRALEIHRLLRWTRNYFQDHRPDLQICVDSSAMNLHFAKVAREMGIPVLYYIAPQLWAWREGRMKKLRACVDRLACILPFEEKYFCSHGVNATFTGHPLFDQLPQQEQSELAVRDPSKRPVVGLLPGSRKSEAQHNFPHLLDVARRIVDVIPSASFLIPTTPATDPVVRREAGALRGTLPPMEIEQDGFNRLVPRCDLCITVSGTATLHVAALGVPMIVIYRASPLLWHAAGRWLVKTRTFALVNVLAGGLPPGRMSGTSHHIVPEFIPWYGSNEPVARLAIDFLQNPGKLAAQRSKLANLVSTLGGRGASDRVAGLALELMDGRREISETRP